jgi:LmbE family N-acetylglucosaminyl deacetylase
MQRIWRITHRTSIEIAEVKKSRVLVVAPHRDDETFACGGLLLRHRSTGSQIGVVFITDSAGSSSEPTERERCIKVRNAETERVRKQLDFEIVADLAIPDGKAVRYERQIAEGLIDSIKRFSPDIIIAPTPVDNHRDHQASAIGVADALKALSFKGEVWSYEMWSAIWPNVVIDISEVQPEKQELIKMYESQLGGWAYDSAVEGLNRYRGLSCQLQYAEAYFRGSAKQYCHSVNELDNL